MDLTFIRTVFADNQVEEAFRYMAAGRHIGKVLIKVRNEKNLVDCSPLALARYYCLKDRSYIILGGLGGFGLELGRIIRFFLFLSRRIYVGLNEGAKITFQPIGWY